MRNKIVAGNWKMNLSFQEAEDLIHDLMDQLDEVKPTAEVIICPSFPFIEMATDYMEEGLFKVGAQNISPFDSGAYTGEVSAAMLASMDITHCILGHSERRKYFT